MLPAKSKQPINFLHPKLSAKVSCSSPSADDYEASNLISSDYSVKSRGFLAYYSIKPPVELEFKFLCNVEVYFIKLNTTVGSQKCSGIEILGKTNEKLPYVSLGKVTYEKAGLFFCNRRKYDSSMLLSNEIDKHICFFNRNTHRIFLNMEFLKVVIFKTEKSVPCLGSIEVWGTPARSCSRVTVETVYKIMSTSLQNANFSSTAVEDNNTKTSDGSEFEIPSDFKDDLTYEIMTLPMTLPSGKTVDQKTLDKHIKNEKSFARNPCDPFTGKKFSDSCKPILNAALKSRIDMFLIQNSHRPETFNLPRIVGKYNNLESTSRKRKLSGGEDNTNVQIRRETSTELKLTNNECSVCKLSNNLYSIACNHVYCRNCVLDISKKLKCQQCGIPFQKDDIEKFHFK